MRILKVVSVISLLVMSSLGLSMECTANKNYGELIIPLIEGESAGQYEVNLDGYNFWASNIGKQLHLQILDLRNANVHSVTWVESYTPGTEAYTTLNTDLGNYVLSCK